MFKKLKGISLLTIIDSLNHCDCDISLCVHIYIDKTLNCFRF
jgi:hypothetical protein